MLLLEGQWTGVITYGPEYGEFEGKELYFEAQFIQTADTFNGTAIDTGGAFPQEEEATISGFIEEDEISFVKQYPYDGIIEEDGTVISDKNKPGPEINYFGKYNALNGTFEGTWEIATDAFEYGYGWFENVATGTWTMKRK